MRWRERLLFEAGGSGRPPVLVDGDGAVATSPVEMLLVAAATCAASDVVLILEKQRVALGALEVALRGTRRDEQPRRYTLSSRSRAWGWTRLRPAARSISPSRSTVRSSPPSPPTSTSATTSRFARTVVAATGLAVGVAVSARAQAVSATEIGAGATVVLAHRAFWGPELGVARRSGGQGRFAVTAACGDYERALGVRLEATVQFLLRPAELRGIGPYGGLGLAFVGSDGARGARYLTALLGVDTGPGARAGWYAELGLGGGVRLALGRRFRRIASSWPHQ